MKVKKKMQQTHKNNIDKCADVTYNCNINTNKCVNATFITNMRKRGERMKVKTIPEINMTDNPLDNIIKMAPYLDEGSQRTVFGMMLEAVMSIKDDGKKAG